MSIGYTGDNGTLDGDGWTILNPSLDSRLVYVSNDGNDTAAAAVHNGRGYYLPTDPEIGPDPTNPVGPIVAYATIHAARGVWGQSGTVGNTTLMNLPDWFMLKRGETFDLNLVDDPISSGSRCDIPVYNMRGRSPEEPFVVAAWGDPADARPILSGKRVHSMKTNTVWLSIEFDNPINSKSYDWSDIGDHCTYEDCLWSKGFGGTPNVSYWDNLTLRRCTIADSWSGTGHNQGLFITSLNNLNPNQYPSILIEECIFDRNGYKQDPNEPTTWTADASAGAPDLPIGEGVQPDRTFFDRNIYGARYGSLTARGNIISRGGGGGSFQSRLGGVMERNLFIFNETALVLGSAEAFEEMWMDGLAVRNTVLHDDIFRPPGGFGQGILVAGHENTFVVSDNVVSHFTWHSNGYGAYGIDGKAVSNKSRAAFMSQGIFTNNVADVRYGASPAALNAYYDPAGDFGINALTVDGNKFRAMEDYRPQNSTHVGLLYRMDLRDDVTSSILWGQGDGNMLSQHTSGNIVSDYDRVTPNFRGYFTFAEWQAEGYDLASTFYTDQAAFETAAGWTDPDRDIVSYMQSVDPTYVVNEDVYVDDGASGAKQTVRQKVWEVLEAIQGGAGNTARTAWAKHAARRYHAFLAFIEKARNNRKGAWDSRWTADAVSNYIRGGYGKTQITGDYDTRSLSAQLADYQEESMSIGYTGDNGTVNADGWTILNPSLDSRLIYISKNGNDTNAAAVYSGRGYYLPTDPEIGPDPTNPIGPVVGYQTILEAAKRVRLSAATGEDANGLPVYPTTSLPNTDLNGFPDWVLFQRGGTYDNVDLLHPNSGKLQSFNIGSLLGGAQQSGTGWDQSKDGGRIWNKCGPLRGKNKFEPAVITAWGLTSDPKPVVCNHDIPGGARDIAITSLDIRGFSGGCSGDEGQMNFGWVLENPDPAAGNILIEDVVSRTAVILSISGLMNYDSGVTKRRCMCLDNFSPTSHNQGVFLNNENLILRMEECLLDRNGYKEDPNEPTTWTAPVNAGTTPLLAGTGVQPERTFFDRNAYLSAYQNLRLSGNIISRGGGGGSVQMRRGGIAQRNLFMFNETAVSSGHSESTGYYGGIFKSNVVLHDDIFLPPGGWGQGIVASGWADDINVIDDNIVCHFHRNNNGQASINASGKDYSDSQPFKDKLINAIIQNNVVYRKYGGIGIEVPPTTHGWGVENATVRNNAVSTESYLSLQGDPSKPSSYTWDLNKYHSTTTDGQFRWGYHNNNDEDWRKSPYTDGTFAQWQAQGYDANSTLTSDFAEFSAAAGWDYPERDILSYMEYVDPNYVTDEDVYVDDSSSGTKQNERQKVWEVLRNNDERFTTDARAKEAAKRYHAFITFIAYARANEKHNWDTRWTAEAVSNYIREGFGKTQITGDYDTRSLSVQLAEYSSPIDLVCDVSSISPTSRVIDYTAETGLTFSVDMNDESCAWSVSTNSPSIITFTTSSGIGDGNVVYNVAENTSGTGRTAEIYIGDLTHSIYQEESMSIGYTGDNGTLDADGWTIYKPSLDSRLVYVANDGNDTEAASVYGRGYYLPTDPEIGPDPTNPIGPIKAYATPNHGWSKVRKIRWASETGNLDTYSRNEADGVPPNVFPQSTRGYPDWLMYKRGDTFVAGKGSGDAYLTNDPGVGFPNNTPLEASPWRGRSNTEPAVMTAWGTPSLPRPVFTSNLGPGAFECDVKYISLDVKDYDMKFQGYAGDLLHDENILVEDCRAKTLGGINSTVNVGLKYRRCTVSGTFNPNAHNQGIFIDSYVGGGGWVQSASPANGGAPLTDVLIEECVFDRNGYKEDPYDASTWTAAVLGGNGFSATTPGLGVQPRRTYFDRNIYVSTGNSDRPTSVTIRGSLFSRAGGGGSVQMRQGGIVERCVWVGDHDPGFIGKDDGIYKNCLHLGSEIFHNQSYYNQGFFINNDYNNDWWGTGAVIDGCIVAGGIADGRHAFAFNSSSQNSTSVSIALVNSDAIRHVGLGIGGFNSGGFDPANWKSIIQSNNRIYIDPDASWSTIDCEEAKDLQFGANSDPCRDIVSYMQSIDNSFIPSEDVYIDEDCTVQQTNRLKVREAWTLYEDVSGRADAYNQSALTDADARLRAKRYHAFLVFIEKAKENRKYAWDTNYTADALNNYIRAGFGKSALSGSYDERDVSTIVSSYFSASDSDVVAEVEADDVQPVESSDETTTETSSTTETSPSEGDGLDDIGYEVLETQESPENVGAIVNQPNYQNYIYPTYFRFVIGALPNLEYFITTATLPSFGYDSALDQPNRFSIIRHPANKVVFSPLELNFLVDENMNNWLELSNWIRKTSVVDDHRDVYETTSDDFTQGTLIITNSAMVPNIEVTFHNMFPISITGFEFNSAVTELTPWTSTVTFAYDYYEVKKL